MTLRRRLTLAFAVLLGLFALNLLIQLWADARRHDRLDRLEAAVERQLTVVAIHQELDDTARELRLLEAVEAERGGLDEVERRALAEQLAEIDAGVDRLVAEGSADQRRQGEALHREVARLRRAWLGDDPALRAEAPGLRTRVDRLLEALVDAEHRAVHQATLDLVDLAHTAARLTLAAFLASLLVAGLVAARTFRQLDTRLGQLREGADRIGAGDLSTPIPVDGRDELGRFARVFNDMAARLAALRETESLLRQEERMASLGKVAAGLAHELNNPAAALRRNIAALGDQLAALGRLGGEMAAQGVSGDALATLEAHRPAVDTSAPAAVLDPLTRADREAELEELLERHGVAEPWELAPDLVRAGVEPEALDEVVGALPEPDRPLALAWWARTRVAEGLLAEATVSASRLSEIVGAVGRYSHLGEAPVGDVDLRAGLEDTLTVLRPRLSGVRVEADLADDLPPVEGHAGELNQVWTILIDNALDALTEARGGAVGDGAELGRLSLATRRAEGDRVVVEVRDDGPGIPEEARRSIFDPFFTTKPVGSGTGLGLHIARQIVERHGGEIEVESDDGGTRFRVLLPAGGMRSAGALESGDPSSSATVDQVVYGREKP